MRCPMCRGLGWYAHLLCLALNLGRKGRPQCPVCLERVRPEHLGDHVAFNHDPAEVARWTA